MSNQYTITFYDETTDLNIIPYIGYCMFDVMNLSFMNIKRQAVDDGDLLECCKRQTHMGHKNENTNLFKFTKKQCKQKQRMHRLN